jgi:hypothetical protein
LVGVAYKTRSDQPKQRVGNQNDQRNDGKHRGPGKAIPAFQFALPRFKDLAWRCLCLKQHTVTARSWHLNAKGIAELFLNGWNAFCDFVLTRPQ